MPSARGLTLAPGRAAAPRLAVLFLFALLLAPTCASSARPAPAPSGAAGEVPVMAKTQPTIATASAPAASRRATGSDRRAPPDGVRSDRMRGTSEWWLR